MSELNIMTWNIQNFGPTKEAKKEIVEVIARVVIENQIDLLIILELNTNSDEKVTSIISTLSEKLNELKGSTTDLYKTRILTPLTGIEYYGFIIKDPQTISPVTLTSLNVNTTPMADFSKCNFKLKTAVTVTDLLNGENFFPTVIPAFKRPPKGMQTRSKVEHWSGERKACVGLFKISFPGGTKDYVAITAVHTRPGGPNDSSSSNQIQSIPYLYVPYQAADDILSLQIDNNQETVKNVIITGDFNIDYCETSKQVMYAPLTNKGYIPVITKECTHLSTIKDYQKKKVLRASLLDNFFLFGTQLGSSEGEVIDIPQLFISGYLKNNAYKMVTYYIPKVKGMICSETAGEIVKNLFDNSFLSAYKEQGIIDLKAKIRKQLLKDEEKQKRNNDFSDYIDLIETGKSRNDVKNHFDEHIKRIFDSHTDKMLYRLGDKTLSLSEGKTPDEEQALILARLVSDHLPVIMRLK